MKEGRERQRGTCTLRENHMMKERKKETDERMKRETKRNRLEEDEHIKKAR